MEGVNWEGNTGVTKEVYMEEVNGGQHMSNQGRLLMGGVNRG